MKIIVSTFNNSKNNYGALFQSCGLCNFLKKMNYDVSYVTIESRFRPRTSLKVKIKLCLKRLIMLPTLNKQKIRTQKLRAFAEETQNRIYYENEHTLRSNPPYGDVYLSGSDQVWNPVNIHRDLMLDYAPIGAKKVSYAASMGNETVPEKNKALFARLIGEYSHISVREDTMIPLLKEYTAKEIHQNIDPVFLMKKEEWRLFEKPYSNLKFKKYILAYILEWNSEYSAKLRDIKRTTGLPIVSVNSGNLKNICADQIIYDASPNEFLYLLANCEFVVASSFHGTAMSFVYNKPVIPFVGEDKPTRIQSLLRHFGLPDNIGLDNMVLDYDSINKIIDHDRILAKDYLVSAIEK